MNATVNYYKKELLPIETERLIIRLLEEGEVDEVIRYVTENRDHLQPWEPLRQEEYYTGEYWKKEIIRRQNEFFLGEGASFAVFFKENSTGPIIGFCNFSTFMYGIFRACFLGYSIDYRYQGQGIMMEALKTAIGFVFDTFQMHRIMANFVPGNLRSRQLLKKLGFEEEGFARDYLKINGKWEDHILTSLINPMV